MSLRCALLVFSSVALLFYIVEGKLSYIETKSGWMNSGNQYRKQLVALRNDGTGFNLKNVLNLGKGRDKRAGNQPTAAPPFILTDDRHQYANVHYSGDESDVVFVLTFDVDGDSGQVTSSALYRSSDYGRTFVNEKSKLPFGARLFPRYHLTSNKSILIFPDDTDKTVYITTDEGRSYIPYNVPVNQKSLLFHPTQSNWMLGHDTTSKQLKVSLNLGKSWTLVADNVRSAGDYTWGVPGVDWNIDAGETSKLTKLYYNTFDPFSVSGGATDADVSLMVTQYPFGSSSSRVFDQSLGLHDDFLIDDRFIFVQRTVNERNSEVELLVSFDRQPFNVARIPFEESHQNYLVGSYRSAQALVVVIHSSGVKNLYLSDETGTYYTLSLDNIAFDSNSGLDLDLVSSMNGTFIANQNIQNGNVDTLRTLITFDNGAEWRLLQAPAINIDGAETYCEVPLCSLHLQMYSTDFSRLGVYSRSSAPGIIIAHGNYGTKLSDDADLYISSDGGLRWQQTLASSWDVQIIDHGGLLVAAKDYRQQDETSILYSCNEGLSWVNFTFTATSTVIWGVVTEPGETTTNVTLFGSEDRTDPEWAIISVDFSNVFPRSCGNADYWDWPVSDGRIENQNCLLGESKVIERRKIDICCLSGEKYERTISATPCECSRADFECDWGYRTDDFSGGTCVIDSSFPQLPDDNPYQLCSSGYRKIAGDTCVGGITNEILGGCVPTTPIPTAGGTSGNDKNGSKNSNTAVLVILAILVLLCMIVIVALGSLVIIFMRRMSSMRQGYQPAATESEHIDFRRTDDEDDDEALLRP